MPVYEYTYMDMDMSPPQDSQSGCLVNGKLLSEATLRGRQKMWLIMVIRIKIVFTAMVISLH